MRDLEQIKYVNAVIKDPVEAVDELPQHVFDEMLVAYQSINHNEEQGLITAEQAREERKEIYAIYN